MLVYVGVIVFRIDVFSSHPMMPVANEVAGSWAWHV